MTQQLWSRSTLGWRELKKSWPIWPQKRLKRKEMMISTEEAQGLCPHPASAPFLMMLTNDTHHPGTFLRRADWRVRVRQEHIRTQAFQADRGPFFRLLPQVD